MVKTNGQVVSSEQNGGVNMTQSIKVRRDLTANILLVTLAGMVLLVPERYQYDE